MKTNGIKRTYYITTDLEDDIRKLAYIRKTTLSAIVREAIEWYMIAPETQEEFDSVPETRLLRRDGTVLTVGEKEKYDVRENGCNKEIIT